ncbi:MAG TPA: hypothetical protein VFJ70_16965 [Burkholderiales bacterium]|nr:hypothetical protein [Burkholderiales bacterium]
MRVDFPELEALNAKARRERAEAVYTFVIAPIARLFTHKAGNRPARAKQRHLPA